MAPNMKAIERLEGVENRLHDTEKDFENSRKEAKKAKDRFQTVKDKRYVNHLCMIFRLHFTNVGTDERVKV